MGTGKQVWNVVIGGCLLAGLGCASTSNNEMPLLCSSTEPRVPLCAPSNANPQAVLALDEGNRLFQAGRYEAARQQYAEAAQFQSDLAEAHYNLGLALQYTGDPENMRKHYIEAANLAPGHKKIWDSPALRRYGDVKIKQSPTTSPVLPAMGGGGGMGGLGGGGNYGGR